ncbi:HNH endonuclease [Micromonospora parva]|uniref:HNH endonuclease n=1 Tax=Micromonospora parva TaxID=1464048 RepID=UPI0033DAD250
MERLLDIKRRHVEWNASLTSGDELPRFVPDPRYPQNAQLNMITSGNQLWNMIIESAATSYAYADHLSEDDEDFIIEFLQNVRDYADIAEDLHSIREQRDAQKYLGTYITGIMERGFFIGANLKRLLYKGGHGDPLPWGTLQIEVQRASDAKVVDKEGKPFDGALNEKGARLVLRTFFLGWLAEASRTDRAAGAIVGEVIPGDSFTAEDVAAWRAVVAELHSEGLVALDEHDPYWSSSAVLTDAGIAEVERTSTWRGLFQYSPKSGAATPAQGA